MLIDTNIADTAKLRTLTKINFQKALHSNETLATLLISEGLTCKLTTSLC